MQHHLCQQLLPLYLPHLDNPAWSRPRVWSPGRKPASQPARLLLVPKQLELDLRQRVKLPVRGSSLGIKLAAD